MTGFEMHRGKLQGFVAAWLAALLVAGCSGAVDEPEVADIEALHAATEEDTGPPADTEVPDDTEVAGEDDRADDPTETTEPADDATETADSDPYAIPEDGIDEAYVERVLNAIFEVNREALALTLDSEPGVVPFEAEELSRSIYDGSYGSIQYRELSAIAESEPARAQFQNPPGSLETEVIRLHRAEAECIVVERTSHFDTVLVEQGHELTDVLALRRLSAYEASAANPTRWQIVDGSFDGPEDVSC
jgi:hypothetical protein